MNHNHVNDDNVSNKILNPFHYKQLQSLNVLTDTNYIGKVFLRRNFKAGFTKVA